MPYFHVSSYAHDGDIYFVNNKPLQDHINHLEMLDVHSYKAFLNAWNMVSDRIEDITSIRKSKWLCELVFEDVRKKFFPASPRRMHSVYLCASLEEAAHFKENFRKEHGKIFEVITTCEVYKNDMAIFTKAEECLFRYKNNLSPDLYEYIKSCAMQYWRAEEPMNQVEYLHEGTVTLKLISTEQITS